MCGNGARCICRYGYETGLAGETQTVETTAGIVTGVRITERLYRIRLNDPTVVKLDCPVEAEGVAWPCSYVELGNPGIPHAVVPWAGLRSVDEGRAPGARAGAAPSPRLPQGCQREFLRAHWVRIPLYERTYERGVEDFTYACGTGTGSVVTVLTLQGKVSGQAVKVQMTGGELIIDAERRGSRVERLFLTGPTNIVCKGRGHRRGPGDLMKTVPSTPFFVFDKERAHEQEDPGSFLRQAELPLPGHFADGHGGRRPAGLVQAGLGP